MSDEENPTNIVPPTESPLQGSDGGPRMATVLQVLPALGTSGGVERGTIEIARAIVESGGRALVASSGGARQYELDRVGAEHITLPLDTKAPLGMYQNIGRLADLIRRENVDIVHARSRAPAWSALYACKRTKRPFLTTFHGTYGRANPLKRLYNSVMTRGELVIAISAFIAGHVRQFYGVPNERIRTIHRGVDVHKFNAANVTAQRVIQLANAWRLTEGYPVVMLPGRLTRWKGQTVFIEAIAKLQRQDVRCLLVGGDQGRLDYRSELESLIERHNLNSVVRLVDNCSDMPAAYMLSDVVVSASTDPEAFGRIVIEAQAMGRPIVATDHGGARETVLPEVTGWLVKPGDADDLAKALEKALSLNEEQRADLARTAVDHVHSKFTTETMCAKTLAVYDEILHGKR